MIGLVVVSHGSLADGLKNAAEMIVGPQPQLRTVGMDPAADLDQLRAAVEAAVRDVGGKTTGRQSKSSRTVSTCILRLSSSIVVARGPQSIALVTDAMPAAGQPVGRYTFLGREVTVAGGAVRLSHGTLAGSVLTLDRAMRNMLTLAGVSWSDAIRMATLTPATIAGVADRKGALKTGADADFVVLDAHGAVRQTWKGGQPVFDASAAAEEEVAKVMPQTSVVIAQPDGLHARPAAQFVKLASSFKSAIRVRLDGREANAKSILSVLSLGESKGAQVELDVQGDDAEPALEQLSAFLLGREAV